MHSCCPPGEEMPFETFFSGRLKVKVTGVKKGLNGHILSLSGP